MSRVEVAVVSGSYNRFAKLVPCINSIRRAVGTLSYQIVIADGGSTDGTVEFLKKQTDVILIHGDLNGVVANYNRCFALTTQEEDPWITIFNDDAEFVGPEPEVQRAVEFLREHPGVGFVNFATDRYGKWEHLRIHGVCYGNYGVTRREVGMAVARFQGDPEGKKWWDPKFHSYAADTAFGLTAMHLGWTIHESDWRVHDPYATQDGEHDPLRMKNNAAYGAEQTRYFMERYGFPSFMAYNRQDAERYGGRVA